jgi:DNA polymerase III sliding clamp (beta) subunit (PCNA family)
VARRGTIPILTHVKLQSQEHGELGIFASDLDLSYSGSIGLVEGDGRVGACIALEGLHAAVSAFAGDVVGLTFGSTSVKLESGGARGSLPAKSAEDFPSEPPVLAAQCMARLPFAELAELLRIASRFASNDPKKASTWASALRLLSEDGVLTALGSDIKIAARLTATAEVENAHSLTAPASTLAKLAGVKAEGAAELLKTEYHGAIRSEEGWRFAFRLAEATFPDMEWLLKSLDQEVLRVDLSALAAAVERAASFAGLLHFNGAIGAESITLTTLANDYREELPCVGDISAPLVFATYITSLRPILESSNGEVVVYQDGSRSTFARALRIAPESGEREFMIAGIDPTDIKPGEEDG